MEKKWRKRYLSTIFDFVKVQIQSCLSQAATSQNLLSLWKCILISFGFESIKMCDIREREIQTYLFSIQLKVRSVLLFLFFFSPAVEIMFQNLNTACTHSARASGFENWNDKTYSATQCFVKSWLSSSIKTLHNADLVGEGSLSLSPSCTCLVNKFCVDFWLATWKIIINLCHLK